MNARNRTQAVYVISVAAELAGMHPQTLRIYERRGLVNPARTRGGNRRYSEADLLRGPGNLLGRVGQHVIDRPRAPESGFDVWSWTGRSPLGQQLVDIAPVAKVGWNTAGRGVGLANEALFLQPSHDAPQRGRGHPETPAGQP